MVRKVKVFSCTEYFIDWLRSSQVGLHEVLQPCRSTFYIRISFGFPSCKGFLHYSNRLCSKSFVLCFFEVLAERWNFKTAKATLTLYQSCTLPIRAPVLAPSANYQNKSTSVEFLLPPPAPTAILAFFLHRAMTAQAKLPTRNTCPSAHAP